MNRFEALDRFEVRSVRTGSLEGSYARVADAVTRAEEIAFDFGDHSFVIDTHLVAADDRIVWRNGEPSDNARTYLVQIGRPEVRGRATMVPA